MKNKKVFIIVFLIFLLALPVLKTMTGLAIGNADVSLKEGYTEITDVPGVRFYMKESLLDKATAIMQINDSIGLDEKNYYVYKNGEDRYIFFNLSNAVLIAQKGTSFHFSESENKKEALKNASVCNVWFDVSGKELNQKSGHGKYITRVNAQVSITKTLYGVFCGELATIEKNGEEWSLFFGVPGEDVDALRSSDLSIIQYTVNSFQPVDSDEVFMEEETDLESPEMETVPAEYERTDSNSLRETSSFEESQRETLSSEENSIVYEQSGVESVEEPEPQIEPEADTELDMTEEPEMANEETVPEKEGNFVKENSSLNDNTQLIAGDNYQKEKTEIEGSYQSSIYSFLTTRECGYTEVVTGMDTMETPVIRINEIKTGADAVEYIKQYGAYYEEPEGVNYQVAIYDINYTDCADMPTVNIKLKGVDGNTLKYRGIKYSKRTYDLSTPVKDVQGWKTGYAVYYEVPNGCKEYVLECGDGTVDNSIQSAYYYISE